MRPPTVLLPLLLLAPFGLGHRLGMGANPKERLEPLETEAPCECDEASMPMCPDALLSPQKVCECENANAFACWLKNAKNCAKPTPNDCTGFSTDTPDNRNILAPVDHEENGIPVLSPEPEVLAPGPAPEQPEHPDESGSGSESDHDHSDSEPDHPAVDLHFFPPPHRHPHPTPAESESSDGPAPPAGTGGLKPGVQLLGNWGNWTAAKVDEKAAKGPARYPSSVVPAPGAIRARATGAIRARATGAAAVVASAGAPGATGAAGGLGEDGTVLENANATLPGPEPIVRRRRVVFVG